MWLNLGSELQQFPLTRLNGPGLRYSLFVQGCPLKCTDDCLNESLLDVVNKHRLSVEQIVQHLDVLKTRYDIEGITVLGGEPFAQADALAEVARAARRMGLTVMVYSGYHLSRLWQASDSGWQALLDASDILVDGPFLADQMSNHLLWRGSCNQRILLLSDAYTCETLTQTALHAAADAVMPPELTVIDPYFQAIEVHFA